MKLEEILPEIRKGRRFRRNSWGVKDCFVKLGPDYLRYSTSQNTFTFDALDFIAEDWELEPQSVTITREQLEKAWDEHVQHLSNRSSCSPTFKDFAKELGL